MMSYPTEAQKGLYISIFWVILNMGSIVGSAITLGQNFSSKGNVPGRLDNTSTDRPRRPDMIEIVHSGTYVRQTINRWKR